MAAQSQTTVKALGLNINPNFLDLPNGSLVRANDVIIKRENVIESRRGLSDWSDNLGISTDRAQQLIEYKGRILANYADKLAFDTGETDINGFEVFNDFAGTYSSASQYRMKSVEANKNLYFTTDNGIKKISAVTADDFTTASGYIQDAGAVKAIDFTSILEIQQGQVDGFLPIDASVAYRTVWGYKDANDNLILGSPSTRNVIYNYATDSFVLDFNKLLNVLDLIGSTTTSLITDTDYYSSLNLSLNTPGTTLKSNIISLCSKLDEDITLGTQPSTAINISSVAVSDPAVITLASPHGFTTGQTFGVLIAGTATTPAINNSYTATATGANTFTIPENVTIGAGAAGTATVSIGAPLTMSTIEMNSVGITTLKFSAGDPTNYISVNDYINLTGMTQTTPDITILNGTHQVTGVTSSQITFTYTPPASGTIVAITATNVDPTTGLASYNYTHILESRNGDQFPVPLNSPDSDNTFPISTPITAGQIATIIDDLSRIVTRLGLELNDVLSSTLISSYITPFTITQSGDVLLKISIPTDSQNNQLGSAYFLQVYRSSVFNAYNGSQLDTSTLGITTTPDDELHLVYEYFPTTTDYTNGYVTYLDTYPDSLAQTNTPLYTNPITGDGILQSNDVPPFAQDISFFKNYTFFANTKTRHLIPNIQLLGVDNITSGDKITIANANTSSTYTFLDGVQEISQFVMSSTSVNSDYFFINSVEDINQYYIWFNVDQTGIDPNPTPPAGVTYIGVEVSILSTDTIQIICQRVAEVINNLIFDFTATNYVSISNIVAGSPTTTITTEYPHELTTGNTIVISGVTQTGGTTINGSQSVTVTSPTTFTIATASSPTGVVFTNLTGGLIASFQLLDSFIVTNITAGIATAASVGTVTGMTVSTIQDGTGEDVANGIVQIGRSLSAAQNIDSTARSFIRVINGNASSPVYAYYNSGDNTSPGQIALQSKVLSDTPFYVISSGTQFNSGTNGIGNSFTPDISPIHVTTGTIVNDGGNPGYITFTANAHGLNNGNQIIITNTDASNSSNISSVTPGTGTTTVTTATSHGLNTGRLVTIAGVTQTGGTTINGLHAVTVTGLNTFTIDTPVLPTGTSLSSATVGFSNVDGVYTVSFVTTNTFDVFINADLTTAGTHFSWELTSDSVVSTNSVKPNRVYYSKYGQPDAVPLLNYFDIGPEDKEILRIFPLRTTLFVFKEDGVYRISGEVAPFNVQLFDSSCVLIAPDSIAVADNTIFGWTTKGITNVTESGTNEISKPVDVDILKLASYPNFKTVTWGVGYNSDYSYTAFTNGAPTDEVATIGYRYSTLTNTWTNIVRSQVSGLIRSTDDKLYMGSGIDNIINKERKNFDRTDYADRDFTLNIGATLVNSTGTVIQFPSVIDIDVGDVLYQEQYLTIYKFNALLQKLDDDPTVGDNDYFSTLEAVIGDNLRLKILALSQKLDSDPGLSFTTYNDHITDKSLTITSNSIDNPTVVTTSVATELVDGRIITISGTQSPSSIPEITNQYEVSDTGTWGVSTTFTVPVDVTTNGGTGLSLITNSNDIRDIKACFNALVTLLNNDPGATYSNYALIEIDTPFEAVIVSIDRVHKKVTLNIGIQWVVGPVQIYKAIPCEIIYSPLTFGDVLKLKQLYQATVMFSNTAFSRATVSFSSDLKPDFISVIFDNLGNGIFGSYSNPGFGFGYFGGGGNAKPFRTLIPLQTQRCRFVNLKFQHKVAREICELYGITITGNIGESDRAYR